MRTYALWLNAAAALATVGMSDGASARARIQAMETTASPLRRGDRALLHWLRSQLAVLESDPATANREAKAAFALAVETGVPWLEFLAQVGLAQVLLNSGERRPAEAALRSATVLAETLSCPLLNLTLGMTTAAFAQKSGNIGATQAALRNALALGRGHGLRYIPALSQESVAELCAVALGETIEQDYVRSLIRAGNLAPPASAMRLRQWPWRFQLRTMGGFVIQRDAVPIEFSGKGPGRPVELLKVLIALGARNVRADQIADALWPRVDADYAHKSFTIALHRLRRMLEDEDALLLRDGRLSLNAALFWVDTWAFEHLISALEDELRDPSTHAQAVFRRHFDAALAVYLGPFLPDESEQACFIACREQMRARIARALTRSVRRTADPGLLEAAEECYLRLIDADPLCEAFHRGLMQCYQRRGDRVEALATFERLRTLLTTRLGSSPSPETQAAYAELRNPP
jgi:DNA-binding SARP family transcriptional activator